MSDTTWTVTVTQAYRGPRMDDVQERNHYHSWEAASAGFRKAVDKAFDCRVILVEYNGRWSRVLAEASMGLKRLAS